MAEKVSLAEMAEAAQERADYHEHSAEHFRDAFPQPERHQEHARKALIFSTMAHVFRLMGSFEEKSRAFIVRLQKEWSR